MPELPETETIARDLDGALRGAVVRSVEVLRADVLRDPTRGGRALRGAAAAREAASFEGALTGTTIVRVWRRAKSIVLGLGERGSVVVTPRFTGALLLRDAERPRTLSSRDHGPRAAAATGAEGDPYSCILVSLDDGRRLAYRDVRRLGTVALLSPAQFTAWDQSLGPEPLDPALTAERFSGILRGSRRAVKSVLMDQARLAGVGNIYANESLFAAGLRPTRAAARVSRAQGAALLAALREILRASIAARGTTFRDYQDAYGGRGGFAAQLQVYGRGGLPCPRCGEPLRETHRLEGRSTVWCGSCQR
ncbi:MAG: bifunctional DNA-formamidopyrimidine glycosylase/DNA-(apurinic or apyrimidinic site) lyase [Gemmatimonadaceae bacterium]|nr:bifunctional DNA-formamidopyrimidine glycosylase/DNA-(apurinic or apyrimidinic site) lyase [Gemmatimonadaceae bacterium]